MARGGSTAGSTPQPALSPGARALLAALDAHGALHLNTTPRFPNVTDIGGSWSNVMELLEAKLCFLSRLVLGKTTYLSLHLYEACAALAPSASRALDAQTVADPLAPDLYRLLEDAGPLATDELALMLAVEPRRVRQALSRLQQGLYVTVFGPQRHLNPNWDTYGWCTRAQWEAACPLLINPLDPLDPPGRPQARERLASALGPYLSERQVNRTIALLERR